MSQRYLLCTDLDRTLLPNGVQPESEDAREYFQIVTEFTDVVVAYVSGRDNVLVKLAIEEYSLPIPDYAVCDVGTTIYSLKDGAWNLLHEWYQSIAPDWNQHSHSAVASLFWDIKDLYLQEWEKQNTFKLSYYVDVSVDSSVLIEKMQARLSDVGIMANLIWSIDEETNTGLLDVIPASATKKHAVEFLQSLESVANNRTLFAGDSGNDLPVLISAIPSVLVANAMAVVKREATLLASSLSTQNALFLAKGDYLGMNGNYSAGILEGLAHFYPELAGRLEKYMGIIDEQNV